MKEFTKQGADLHTTVSGIERFSSALELAEQSTLVAGGNVSNDWGSAQGWEGHRKF